MIESLLNNTPEFILDAVIDTANLIPSLLIIFVVIEIFENFFSHKIAGIVSFSKKLGPIFGAILAIIPQCGFSVIMTTLFIRKYITLGTLIAVYIATSDEAIPILLADTPKFGIIFRIIILKFVIAIIVGYIIDLFVKPHLHHCDEEHQPCTHIQNIETEKGCCNHEIKENKIQNIFVHPIKHTFIISVFILCVCILLNYLFEISGEDFVSNLTFNSNIIQTGFFALFGLIPNCAVSVLITMMYLKGAITFGSVISGLISNAGLGLLVLFTKKESWKSFFLIVSILFLTGFISGIMLNL